MNKILFINPPLHNFLGGCHSETTPLGLMYLAAVLEEAGYEAKVLDAEARQLNWDELKEKLKQENPEIVGVGGTTLSLPALYKTVEIVHNVLPQAKIITGGPGSTFEPKKVLTELPMAEIVVRSEGEKTILNLMEWFHGKKGLKDIKGIAYRENDEVIINSSGEYVEDLNTLPMPAYHLLEPSFSHYQGMHRGGLFYGLEMPNAVIMASRGCPHRCIFCSNNQTKNRRREPKKIVDEVEFCLKKLGAKSIQFYDDEFVGTDETQNQWIEEICAEIIKRGLNNVGYLVQGRCSSYVKLETLKKMRKAGFKWVWWGVESGSQKVLNTIRKDTTIADIKRTFQLAREAGLKSLMFLMIGLPGETEHDVLLTGKLVEKIKPDQIRFHITTPFPGSNLWNMLQAKNQIDDYNFLNYNTRFKAVHHTDELSSQKIEELYKMLVLRYESNKKNLIKVFINSFLSPKEWKKLPGRMKKIFTILPVWIKIKLLSIK